VQNGATPADGATAKSGVDDDDEYVVKEDDDDESSIMFTQ